MYKVNMHLKILAILCFIFISIASVISFLKPSTGFELNIYKSTPFLSWFLLILSIIGGIFLIIHQVYTKQYKYNNFWVIGFFILMLSRVTLLYIPFIRSYYSWRGDNISHMGLLYDILSTSHISSANSYPLTHILLSELILITETSTQFIANHSTALFSTFYVISIYLLATVIFSSRIGGMLSVAAVGGIFFDGYNVFLMPNGWSILYLPFFFYIYFKYFLHKKSISTSLLIIIMIWMYPFFHPLSTVVIILLIPLIGIMLYIINSADGSKNCLSKISPFIHLNIILVELTVFIPWILSFQIFHPNLRNFYNSIISGNSPDVIAKMGSKLDKIDVHGFDFLQLCFKIYGDEIIFLSFCLISFILLYKHRQIRKNNLNLIVILGMIFSIGILYLSYLLNIIPGLGNIGSARLLSYVVILTPLPVAFLLDYYINKNRICISVILVSLIIIASILSIFSLYYSPYTIRPNAQITEMDMAGTKWITYHNDINISNTQILTPLYRFADPILGNNMSRSQFRTNSTFIPDHFNYSVNEFLGSSYNKDNYALITELDITTYSTVWSSVGRFCLDDFEKLSSDISVDKLYCNGETYVYYIHNM